jgi:hypothetical protein
MERHPDPLRAYAHAVRAGDHRLAGLIAARVFRRGRGRTEPDEDPLTPPSPAALATFRRLREHLGI